MKLLSLILGAFLALSATAHDLHYTPNFDSMIRIQYGVGAGTKEQDWFETADKSINIGYYKNVNGILAYNIQVGWLGDDNDPQGKLRALYTFAQFGSILKPFDWLYIENFFGPGFITKTKSQLSGGLQFSVSLGAGWTDPKTGVQVGALWKHISNAGLNRPNLGRDLIMLSAGFPLK